MKSAAVAAMLAMSMMMTGTTMAHEKKRGPEKDELITQEQKPWGIAGDGVVDQTVLVSMADTMRFTPENLVVTQGQTVRFRLANDGKVLHEFVIGTREENDKHAALMIKFPGMEHSEPYMAHVAPGEAGEIVWTFNRPGNFDFACLIAGHYQAGMVGSIQVNER